MYKIFIFLIAFTTLNIVAEQTNVTSNVKTNDILNITTLKGVTYKNCEVTSIWTAGIKIFHSKGIALIPFTDLSAKDKKKYGYSPKEAEEFHNEQAIKAKEYRNEQAILRWEKSIKLFNHWPLKIGETGRINGYHKIIQVIDKQNLLSELTVSQTVRPFSYWTRLVWISGIPTAGLTDGQLSKYPGAYTVTKTKTYSTNAGTKTVFVLEPAKPPMEKKDTPVSKVPTQTNDSQPETTPQLIKTEQQQD